MALRYFIAILAIYSIVSVCCGADTPKNAPSVTTNNARVDCTVVPCTTWYGFNGANAAGTSYVNSGNGNGNYGSVYTLKAVNGGNRVLGYNYYYQQQQRGQQKQGWFYKPVVQQQPQQQNYQVTVSGVSAEPSRLVYYEPLPNGQLKPIAQSTTTPNQPFTTTFLVNGWPQQLITSGGYSIPTGNLYSNGNTQSNYQVSNGVVTDMHVSNEQKSQEVENGGIPSQTPQLNEKGSVSKEKLQRVKHQGSSNKSIEIPVPTQALHQSNENAQGTSQGGNGVNTISSMPNEQSQGVICNYTVCLPTIIPTKNVQEMAKAQINAYIANNNCVFIPLSNWPYPVFGGNVFYNSYSVLKPQETVDPNTPISNAESTASTSS